MCGYAGDQAQSRIEPLGPELVRMQQRRVWALDLEDIRFCEAAPRRAQRRVLSCRGEPCIDRTDRRPAHESVREQRVTVRDAGAFGESADETGLICAASAAAAEHERM